MIITLKNLFTKEINLQKNSSYVKSSGISPDSITELSSGKNGPSKIRTLGFSSAIFNKTFSNTSRFTFDLEKYGPAHTFIL